MKTGIRFNVIVSITVVTDNGQTIAFNQKITATDQPISRLPYLIHQAQLEYPQDKVFIEPTRLYTYADYFENN